MKKEESGLESHVLPEMEKRLKKRYGQLVNEHAQAGQSLAAGLNALPGMAGSFASTQGAWRFYGNEKVSLKVLAQPLVEQGRRGLAESGGEYGLVMHDWSHLNYHRHGSKKDCEVKGPQQQRGYELQTSLLVCGQTGNPLAPLCQNLVSAEGIHSTRAQAMLPGEPHLDELTERMKYLEKLDLGLPLVHIIDREGDSVGHFRQWREQNFIVRVKGGQRVQWQGQSCLLHAVVKELQQQKAFTFSRPVEYRGRAASQYIAETQVILSRAAHPRRQGTKRKLIAGKPVTLRLVISEVRDAEGKVLAVWLLLSNLSEVSASQLALWYYWRWRIESFFKLLKGAGLQLEHWQQENGLAIAKRLLVASMACVLIWQLARSQTPEAAQLRHVLIRLSGRQMKYGTDFTTPALLEGVWVLLSMLDLLQTHDLSELKQLANRFFNLQ